MIDDLNGMNMNMNDANTNDMLDQANPNHDNNNRLTELEGRTIKVLKILAAIYCTSLIVEIAGIVFLAVGGAELNLTRNNLKGQIFVLTGATALSSALFCCIGVCAGLILAGSEREMNHMQADVEAQFNGN